MNVGHRWDRGLPGHGVSWRVKLLLAKRRTGAPTETRAEATSENSWEWGGGGRTGREEKEDWKANDSAMCAQFACHALVDEKKGEKKKRENSSLPSCCVACRCLGARAFGCLATAVSHPSTLPLQLEQLQLGGCWC